MPFSPTTILVLIYYSPLRPVQEKPPSKKAKLSFSEMGRRQKDRTTAKIRAENEEDAIIAAAMQVFRSKGQNDAAHVVKNLYQNENAEKLAKLLPRMKQIV